MSHRTKIWLLAVLMLVWVGMLVFRFTSREETHNIPLTFTSGQKVAKESVTKSVSVPTVAKLATFRAPDASFTTPKNIFAPLNETVASTETKAARKVAKAKPKAAVIPASAIVPVLPVPPPPSPEELAAQRIRQQREQAAQQARQLMGQYRFIGFLTEDGEPRAFVGKGRELYIVRMGETLDGQIQVGTIEPSALKLRDATANVETSIPLLHEGKPVGF